MITNVSQFTINCQEKFDLAESKARRASMANIPVHSGGIDGGRFFPVASSEGFTMERLKYPQFRAN